LGLDFETHEEIHRIHGKTYNPDIKFTWHVSQQEKVLVYCEVKWAKQGAYTKLVDQVRSGRTLLARDFTLFVGFLMREPKQKRNANPEPDKALWKLEFVICEGYRAKDFSELVMSSKKFQIHPLFESFESS
jgi:hypothetical protein